MKIVAFSILFGFIILGIYNLGIMIECQTFQTTGKISSRGIAEGEECFHHLITIKADEYEFTIESQELYNSDLQFIYVTYEVTTTTNVITGKEKKEAKIIEIKEMK